MSANRKIRPEVQEIFDKYISNNLVKRMGKKEAIHMFETEFRLQTKHAEEFFKHFDTDENDSLSLWEFQHFYNVVGESASELAAQFEALDGSHCGFLSREETRTAIAATRLTPDGGSMEAKEIEYFLKTTVSADKSDMDLGKFADLTMRLKIYVKQKKT